MPRITRVYTKQGDWGETRLAGGETLPKDSPRIEAYGTVDELSSQIGVALAAGGHARVREILGALQNDLFHLGSSLAFLPDAAGHVPGPAVGESHVKALEGWIDALNAELEPLANFILPGGSPAGAQLHLARCICRRAERRVVSLGKEPGRQGHVPEQAVVYLNRLSDLLFVLARWENAQAGAPETLWDSRR